MSTTITASKANIQNATTTNLNVAKITGSVIATPKEIKDGIVTNKVVTPFSAKLALSLFTSLGNAGTNANFTTVTMADFAGNVIADSKTAIAGTSSSKIITPLTLLSVLNNPGKIGLQTPNNAIFTNITADSIQGDVIASGSEISAGSVNNKTISPFEMYNSLQAPSVIGSSNPGAAKFSNVTATSLNLSTDILQVSEGGLGTNSFNRGDILVASDSTVISKLSSGKDGQFLQADSKEPYGMKWVDSPAPPQTSESITGATNTEALNSTVNNKALVPSNLPSLFQTPYPIGGSSAPDATFTTMNINGTLTLTNPIGPKSGGTSMKTYSKGDLIVATDQYSLSTLPVGNKDKYLLADSTTSTGLKWDSVVFGSTSGYPSGYSNIGQITKINNHKYNISYVNARNASDNDNISLNNQTFDFSLVNGIGNAVYCGSRIQGTVTVKGSHLLGTGTTFTSLTVGNYISVENINFRIMDIISDTDLVVDKPCAQTSGVTMTMPTVGSALSTTISKFGSSSLYVNASNYLSVDGVQFNKTFTIEFWINVSIINTNVNIINFNNLSIQIYYTTGTSNNIVLRTDSTTYNSLIPYVKGKWQHFAISNDGSNAYVFLDGKMIMDLSKIGSFNQMILWPVYLFQTSDTSSQFYVDSLKISNYGKYSSEFIPCENQFSIDPCTTMICQFEGTNGSTTYNIDTLSTATSFVPYNSYDLTNKRLHMYATTGNNIVFHYLNSNAGDDVSNMGPSSVVQLPYYIDLNVNGLVNVYGLTKNKTSCDSYDKFSIAGSSISTKYNVLDNLSNSVVENNQVVPLESLSIDTGVSQSVYKSTVLNGTVSVSGTTVTGSGTSFTTSFVVGDYIHVINTQEKLQVSAITDATTMTVSTSATTTSGSYYYKFTTVAPTITSSAITGTVDITNTSVSGTDTAFTTDLSVGDVIKGRNGSAAIKSIASNTSLTLTSNINTPIIDSTVNSSLATSYCMRSYLYSMDSFFQTNPTLQAFYTSSGGLNNRPFYTFTSSISALTASTPLNINTNGGLTMFLLINPTVTNIGSSYIFKTDYAPGYTQIQIGGNNGNLELRIRNSSGVVTYFNSVVYSSINSTSTWYLFTFRYSKATNQMQFYVNKSLSNTFNSNQSTALPDITGTSYLSNDVNVSAFYLYDSLLSTQETSDMNDYLYSGAAFPTISVNPALLFDPLRNKNITTISTSQSKFGSSSLKAVNSVTGVNLNTIVPNSLREYTVDFWVYATSNTGTLVSWANQSFGYTHSSFDRLELYASSGTIGLYRLSPVNNNNLAINQSNIGSFTANSWNHVAVCQDLNMFAVYLNGTAIYSTTTINPISSNVIGSIQIGKGFTECYIDELALSSINKYIANFTPSSTEYTRKISTLSLKHFNGTDGSTDINIDRLYEVQGESINKISHGNLELALRGSLYGFGKLIYSKYSTLSSDIMVGDRLYLPLVNKTVSVTSVLASDLLVVSENITPASNVNNCNWTACGQAILSKDEKLFGSTSLFIQNNTYNARSYAVVQAPSNCYLTNGWTIEFNFYNTHKGSGTNTLFTMRTRNSGTNPGRNALSLVITDASAYILSVRNDNVITSASAAIRTGMWHHIAMVCTGASVTFYLSGKSVGSVAYNGNMGMDYFVFGANDILSNPINAMYYDEFRLSTNARYSSAFIVPQKRFEWDEYTLLLNHFDGPIGSNNLNLSEEAIYGYRVDNMIGYPIMGWRQNTNSVTSLTGSVYINDNIVYGVNTTFTTRFNPGDNIVVGGQRYKVLKVIGDTSMLVDSSILAPINKTNGATLSNAQSKFGTNSLSLNGSSTMTISNLGKKLFTEAFTLETWFYPISTSGVFMSIIKTNTISDGQLAFSVVSGSLRVTNSTGGSSINVTSTNQLTMNSWNHIALCMNNQTIAIFVNGIMTKASNIGMMKCLDTNIILGSSYAYTPFFTCYLDELRISTVCRYNSDFSVPTSAFNNDSQTMLLYHFDDTQLHSNTGIALPVGSDVTVSTSIKQYGTGSLAFGTSRSGHLKLNALSGSSYSFTVEFWAYIVENPTVEASIFSIRSTKCTAPVVNLTISSNNLYLYTSNNNSIWSSTNNTAFTSFNTWTHMAVVYNISGSTIKLFVGGVEKFSASASLSELNAETSSIIFNEYDPCLNQFSGNYGYKPMMTGKSFYGYIDDLRVSSNARYTSGFTVPGSALTSDANTLYLLNCDSIASLNPTNLMTNSSDIVNGYPNTFDYGIQKQSTNNHLYTYMLSEKNKASQLMLSPANVDNNETLMTLPSGYTAKNAKQLPFVVSYGPDGHLLQSTFINKRMAFTSRPKFSLSTTNSNTWYELAVGHYIPNNCNMFSCLVEIITSAGFTAQFSASNSGSAPRVISNSSASKYSVNTMLPCSNGKIYIKSSVNSRISITIMGFNVNL